VQFPPKTINGYRAGPGWDPVTGWGSPDAQQLIPLLARYATPRQSGQRSFPWGSSDAEVSTVNRGWDRTVVFGSDWTDPVGQRCVANPADSTTAAELTRHVYQSIGDESPISLAVST
jgi:hypothetical protein